MDRELQRKSNKAIIFKPRRQFRILQGKTQLSNIRKDLSTYNHHLRAVFTAAPKIDNAAPFLNPYVYLNPRKLRNDADRMVQIDSDNKMLIGRINAINRSPPKVDCWNTYKKGPSLARTKYNNDWARTMANNLRILHSIKSAKSAYSKKDMLKRWKKVTFAFENSIRLSKVFHIQKPLDVLLAEQPSLTAGLAVEYDLPRKKAFLDFAIKDGVRLGQVVVELYYQHAPKIVKNFLAHCDESSENNYKNCRIHYAEKNKFMVLGDVTSNNGRGGHSIYRHNIDLESNGLKPTRPGVLMAMPIERSRKFDPNLTIRQRIIQPPPELKYNSQFAITISSCCNADHKMPVFGKIIKGNSVLSKINDMLRKCGTPLVTIVVSRCGCIPFTKEEEKIFNNVKAQMAQAGIELDEGEPV